MAHYQVELGDEMRMSMSVACDTRYSFTSQFLYAAAMHSRCSFQIEAKPPAVVSEEDIIAHRGYVVGAIMQATAALEAEIWEVTAHGPGHHLGSDNLDREGRDILVPQAKKIDKKPALLRYEEVLSLLKKDSISRSDPGYEDAAFLIRLRNKIVHYKSQWGAKDEQSTVELLDALRQKNHARPPFALGNMNFFPHYCLSASCAAWAVDTSVAFLDAFYCRLEMPSPFDSQRQRLLPRLGSEQSNG
jgi:hypothetical protein